MIRPASRVYARIPKVCKIILKKLKKLFVLPNKIKDKETLVEPLVVMEPL